MDLIWEGLREAVRLLLHNRDAVYEIALRTVYVSGVATRLLAREYAGDVEDGRAGVRARSPLEALACCRSTWAAPHPGRSAQAA